MNLKKSLFTILSAAAALSLPSCFHHESTVHLKKDGSGTLVEETRMGGQMLEMMNQFAGALGGGDANSADPIKDLLSEEKAKKRATEMGEGVTLEKIEPVTVGTSKGARATYRFADINKLRISSEDSMKGMSPPGGISKLNKPIAESKPMVFNYKDGVLTIVTNSEENAGKPDAEQKAEAAENLDDPQSMAMMKEMLADMKLSVKLVVDSGIEETNATHRDGDTITLMEMDMNKLMEKPESLKKLAQIDQNDPTAAMEALKGIDGVKVEVKPEITVKLK